MKQENTNTEVLVIDRSKWYRGRGSAESRLVRTGDYLMCCLGFCLLQRGFSQGELLDIGSPNEVGSIDRDESGAIDRAKGLIERFDDTLDTYETHTTECLINVNDNEDIDEETREAQITDLFAGIGVDVRFIN